MAERVIALVVAAAVLTGAPAVAFTVQAESKRYVGRAVADVLGELQAAKLKIIFSTELVPPSIKVTKEPRGTDAREIALQILEPHGLTLQPGPGGTLLVVAARRSKPESPKTPRPKPDAVQSPATPDAIEPFRVAEHVEVTDRPGQGGAGARGYAVEPSAVREMAGGMENVLQAVQVLPGVAGTNDEEGKLAIRGAGPEHNMIVLDGVQIHQAQRLGEFTTSFLNPATAASVTLDASGLDARYGGRLSSVLNLETRDGTTARALATSGAIGLTSGDVLLEGRMPGTDSGSWWATARGTYYRVVTDRFSDGAMPSFGDVQFKTTLFPSERTRLTIFGLAGRETLLELNADPGEPTVVTASNRGENRIGAATLRWVPTSRFSSTTIVSAYSTTAHYMDRRLSTFSDFGVFDRRMTVQDVAVRQQLLYASSPGPVFDAGVDLHRVRSSWQMDGLKQPEWWRGVGPSTWGELVDYSAGPMDSRLERTQAGAWFQVRLGAGRLMTIEPGVRADWNSFTGEVAWQPRLRVSRAFGQTSVWAGYAIQAQTPSHESLQSFEFLDFSEENTTRLQNARTEQVVAGFERPIRAGLSLRVEGYHRTFDGLLVQRQETEAERQNRLVDYDIPPDLPSDAVILEYRPTVFPESAGTGRAAGIEFLLRRDRGRVTGWLGYTLSKSTRELYGRTVPFDFDRRHALTAVLDAPLGARFRAAATWQLASGFPVTPIQREVEFGKVNHLDGTRDPRYRTFRDRNGNLVMMENVFMRRLSSINSERLTGYARLDVRVTYSTGKHWEFYGEVLNLFNHRNYLQPLHGTSNEGEQEVIGKSNVYNTFERLLSFGLRMKF